MENINLGSLQKYSLFEAVNADGEVNAITFEKGCRASLEYVASNDGYIRVIRPDGQEPITVPVKGGCGRLSFSDPSAVQVTFEDINVVYVSLVAKDMRVQKRERENFTDISPRPSVDPQIYAYQRLLEQMAVQNQVQAANLAKLEKQVVEPDPAPAADPAPVADPAPAADPAPVATTAHTGGEHEME